MLPRAAAPRQHTDTSYIPSQHGQGGALARHSSARARLVGTEAPKILSLLASLGERPLQPRPGAPLGGPRHNVPFPGLFFLSPHCKVSQETCAAGQHPAASWTFKHPGLDTKAAPKLPLTLTLSTGMCCSVAHSPCPGTQPLPWHSPHLHIPQGRGTTSVPCALPGPRVALPCLAGISRAGQAAELLPPTTPLQGHPPVPPSSGAVTLKPSSLNLNEENPGDKCFI